MRNQAEALRRAAQYHRERRWRVQEEKRKRVLHEVPGIDQVNWQIRPGQAWRVLEAGPAISSDATYADADLAARRNELLAKMRAGPATSSDATYADDSLAAIRLEKVAEMRKVIKAHSEGSSDPAAS